MKALIDRIITKHTYSLPHTLKHAAEEIDEQLFEHYMSFTDWVRKAPHNKDMTNKQMYEYWKNRIYR